MLHRSRAFAVVVVASALGTVLAPTAWATQSVTNSFKCTITAKPPTLAGTTLTTYAVVNCAKAATITIDIKAVEMDSGTEQSNAVMAENKTLSVYVAAGKDVTISTSGTCLNTESGNEEFATKVRVGIGTKYSNYDRTSPANDSYSC